MLKKSLEKKDVETQEVKQDPHSQIQKNKSIEKPTRAPHTHTHKML